MVEYRMEFSKLFTNTGLFAAHRGAQTEAAENTLLAVIQSVGKCDFVEVDVQLSSDGVGVIIHDETLERTTDVKKRSEYKERAPYRVSDFTFDELSTLDYGSWFDGRHEPVFTLIQLLEFMKESGIFVNIEIKDMHRDFDDEYVVSTILNEIEKRHLLHQVLISSFRHEYLPLCKRILPKVATAALFEDDIPDDLIGYLKELDVDAAHFDYRHIHRSMVKKLKEAGFIVNVYTVNDPMLFDKLFDIGVNGVFTDFI